MAGLNKVQLIGRLGNDPETRYMPSGDAVTNVSIATSDTWKDKTTGERQERTEWHRVVFFGRVAEIAGEYLRKGSQCYVEGKLRTRKWQDKDGADKYTTEIVVDVGGTLQLLDGKPQGDGGGERQSTPQQQRQAPAGGRQSAPAAPPPAGFDDFDDDIPF